MYPSLLNKVVCITGGCSGIGYATAQRFYKEGSIVIIIDKAIKKKNEIIQNNGIYFIKSDVSNRKEMESTFRRIWTQFRKIDVVIANAGISIRHKFLNITENDWRKTIDVNLHGVFNTVQLAAKIMINSKMGKGIILIVGSTNGLISHSYYADYNASKAAVILLGKTMARELAPQVRVNTICPGYVLTPMQKQEYTPNMINKVNKIIPLKRHAKPKEIASLMVFLASNEAAYITGQTLIIDGGEIA